MRRLVIVALVVLGIAALRDVARLGDASPLHRLYDFQDFYCAGAALDRGADPYRYEPLRTCEHEVNQSAAYRSDPSRVVPAPLPPYDFPPLMLIARVPFAQARTIAAIGILAAVGAAAVGLSLLAIPLDIAFLALLLPAGFLLLDAGQIVPFALLAIVSCGVALARGRDPLAGILAGASLIEPHLGFPVFAAVCVLAGRARIAGLLTGIVLAGLGILVDGPNEALEYLLRVLPAQAGAEASYVYQYSLTYVLTYLGMPARGALIAGQLAYAIALIAGVWCAGRIARVMGRRELLAFVPAAFGIVGGSYVHMVDLALAIPATLVLATRLQGRTRTLAAMALCALAVPWIAVWIDKKLFLASLFVVAMLLFRLQINGRVAIAGCAAFAAAIYGFELFPPPPFPASAAAPRFAPDSLAQTAWTAYVRAIPTNSPAWFWIKLPTWAALFAAIVAARGALTRGARPPA